MRLFFAAVTLAVLFPAGCSTPVEKEKPAAQSPAPSNANAQLVKLHLPGMT